MILFLVTISAENKSKSQVFPEAICNLPKADIKFDGITAYLSQSDTHQILFMESEKDIDFSEQAHSAHFGIVLEGKIDFMIDGKRQSYTRGDRYYITDGVKYTLKIHAGYAGITFFNEPNQYSQK